MSQSSSSPALASQGGSAMRALAVLAGTFPWLTIGQVFALTRVATAGLFLAHAVVRITANTIPEFALFMANVGFPQPVAVVWAITITELIASAMLILRWRVRFATAALIAIVGEGIVLIHRHNGWFVGEHGVGGSEYSVALILLLLLISAEDATRPGRVG